ncbi:MAG: FkbM family methyltransferase [Wenzhouxiangella sp.]|nr:MAG: FkbM family methyltransferase [Wenzhouxiangella sp.]
MPESLKSRYGLLRSLLIYRHPGRQRSLRRFYRPLIQPDDLVFDVGAHLGDRASAFAGLGARVVALEPQPRLFAWLERLTRRSGRVTCLPLALGAVPGRLSLSGSRANPTVASLSASWRDQVRQARTGFDKVDWDEAVTVEVTTLDALIDRFGVPAFCKIDVEGFEAEVLAGLSRPLASLSLEFVQGALDRARECVDRLHSLAPYRYQVVAGEQRYFLFDDWVDARSIDQWLLAGAGGLASGDLYARRVPEAESTADRVS